MIPVAAVLVAALAAAVPLPLVTPTATGTGARAKALEVPVEISGKKVQYQGAKGRALFTGGVTVLRGATRMTSDELETIRGSSEAVARGHVVLTDREHQMDLTCRELQYTHGLRQAEARGDCELISGTGEDVTVVTASTMQVFLDAREATAHENVRIVQGPNEARCVDAHLFGAEDRVVLTGRPVLRRPPHEFVCDEVVSFFKQGRSVLSGNVSGKLTLAGLGDLKKEGRTP